MIGLKRGTVQVVPYRKEWKELFIQAAMQLRESLGSHIVCIEHVGSTSIEGMDAKPILDIMAGVVNLEKAKELIPLVETLDYEYKENDDVPGRIFFVKGPENKRTHHLSLVAISSENWNNHILFRNYMRTHASAFQEYKELKLELAQKYPDKRAFYTDGKEKFVAKILKTANANT